MKKNKKVQMLRPSHMSVEYHETETKIATTILVNRKPVVKAVLTKNTGKTVIKILADEGKRVLEEYLRTC